MATMQNTLKAAAKDGVAITLDLVIDCIQDDINENSRDTPTTLGDMKSFVEAIKRDVMKRLDSQ